MKLDYRQKVFASIGLALIAVGGFGVWSLDDLEHRARPHATMSVEKSAEPTDKNPTMPTPFIVKEVPEKPSSDPQIITDGNHPPLRSKPPLLQLADLLAEARHGMERSSFDELFGRWLGTLSTGDILAVLTSLSREDLGDSFLSDLNARLVRRLSEADVNLALGAVNAMPEGAARVLASENLAVVWANEQFPAAIGWAAQLPAGVERDHDLFAVASEAVRTQPTEALRLADELPPGSARDELVSRAISEWAVADPDAAISWSKSIADDTLREQAIAGATAAWSSHDPAAAGAFALAELSPGRTQDDAVTSVAQRWAQQSPTAAAAWVQSLPDGGLKNAAALNVASIWRQRDVSASEQWFAQTVGP